MWGYTDAQTLATIAFEDSITAGPASALFGVLFFHTISAKITTPMQGD
jgi:hypothetical protein